MLHILNAQERNQAFRKFMFLFLLTIVMIIVAVYFNSKLPLKTNDVLSDQLATYREGETELQKISALMDSTKNMIDSFGKSQIKDLDLRRQIDKLNSLSKDGIHGDLNKTILSVLINYYDVKSKLMELKDAPDRITDLNNKLEQRDRDLNEAKRDLDICRKSASLGF